mmetsp:Transcript_26964/g.48748  ORF Transcript_26964/g.48748 Transcript_26964/m.48748 type:complete len:616 (+) Transcript_26964:88-1935(+)|eukprot:CAMPEP_0197627732 /NCGR_PEP_ID=MMETSP1338-20131121/6262_1 /TAXON_ID=43686 ORGANISM="Pelagodinium beii, Strain RCC1491" /NCGR_SAMPLE_ID=MMETSP1338 /ASSEMBLY_ACC=CAM_ASM_000754 /LENGTH=615 /DNA_ID=CAMNT_0043198535 /DNA_START=22 /DNA_END=1872 /DNA_ORIENTATION=-
MAESSKVTLTKANTKRGGFIDPTMRRPLGEEEDHGQGQASAKKKNGADLVKPEDEVRQAELEVRLREMVLEVTAPTVERSVRLQNHCDHLSNRLQKQHQILMAMADDVRESKEQLDLVHHFKIQLDGFWNSQRDLEVKLAKHTKEVMSQVEQSAQQCGTLMSTTNLLNKQIMRTQEDSDGLRNDITKMQANLDMGIKKNKEYLDNEIKRMDFNVSQVKNMHQALSDEIWGPEDVTDVSPPSLRRFDMQTRKLEKTIREVLQELMTLRLLDGQVKKVTEIQGQHDTQLLTLTADHKALDERVDQNNKDTKAEIKKTANLMAAYSANLVKDVRGTFSNEVKELSSLSEDVQRFLKQTEESMNTLDEALQASGRTLEAAMKEVRLDIEGLDARRKRDKLGLEDSIDLLDKQVSGSVDTADQLLKSLEHMSGVIGMSLQGQRMVVALSVQDYIDRKDQTLVGIKKHDGKIKGGKQATKLDLDDLIRMTYRPLSISFQGSNFERPQALALCEKLIHAGQEALSKGPSGGPPTAQHLLSRPGTTQKSDRGSSAASDVAFPGELTGWQKPLKDDRVSTAATTASKPMTADSTLGLSRFGGYSPPSTSESSRLPALATPLTAR